MRLVEGGVGQCPKAIGSVQAARAAQYVGRKVDRSWGHGLMATCSLWHEACGVAWREGKDNLELGCRCQLAECDAVGPAA